MNRPPKLCLVCSRGGHLMQLLKLEKVFAQRAHFLITTAGAGQHEELSHFKQIHFIADINEWRWLKNPFKFLWAILQTLRIFFIERPDFVISTGSGIAVPAFLLAVPFAARSIYVEDGARVIIPSLAGKLCYRLADLFFVQHPEMCERMPRAIYKGALCRNLDF